MVIDRRKQKLEEWKTKLDQKTKQLDSREARILESEPFLPLARQLQEMKLDITNFLPWIETIREKAEVENVDIRTSGINLTRELRLFRLFGGLDKSVKQLEGELKMLNISITQKQPVITALLKLQQNGVKDDDIIGLSKIIDLSRMGREWTPFGSRTGQGNGPNGNYNVNSSSNSNNGNGNFSMNDLIKLNLLKSNTTNMLNRSH
ncbi:MAG: hypothetical protein WAK17_12205 [Candidatus Nitrosopolaris sp.]